jgi:hypothetical protein
MSCGGIAHCSNQWTVVIGISSGNDVDIIYARTFPTGSFIGLLPLVAAQQSKVDASFYYCLPSEFQ